MRLENEIPKKQHKEGSVDLSRRDFLKVLGRTAIGAIVATSGFRQITEVAQVNKLVENKFINKDGKCEFIFTHANPGEAHKSANKFQKEVGDALKVAYPSRVLDPNVAIQILRINGQKFYRFIWSCRIVKSTEADADYYFDRRGTLKPGRTLAEAKGEVETELEKSRKVQEMRAIWKGRGIIYPTFIKDSFSGSNTEGFWYIKEFFMVIPK